MKKLIPLFGITLLIAACNTVPDSKTDSAMAQPVLQQPDTTGMAAFNAWKAQNELASVTQQPVAAQAAAPERTRTIVKYVPVRQKSAPVTRASTTSTTGSSSTSGTGSTAGNGDGSMNNESSQTAKVDKKEGWSKAAKGAVIGGVAGAAGGAIINKKNRVAGAVIGGVIGAAGGYGIGRNMDKKDGRIDYSILN